MEFSATPENLAMVAGVLLSLAFSYIPGLRGWFDNFGVEQKRLIMLALLALTTAGAFGLACAGILSGIVCTVPGAVDAVWAFILAVIANQSAYLITPQVGQPSDE